MIESESEKGVKRREREKKERVSEMERENHREGRVKMRRQRLEMMSPI